MTEKLWTVTLGPPRAGSRERGTQMRAYGPPLPNGRPSERRMTTTCADGRLATPDEAELQRAAWERDLNEGELAARRARDPKRHAVLLDLVDARLAWMRQDRTKSPHTITGAVIARSALAPIIAPLTVAGFDRAALLGVRDDLQKLDRRGKPLRPVTINTYIGQLKASWNWAAERNLVATAWPKLKGLAKGARRKRPYTDAEVRALVDWVAAREPVWHPLVALLADTGRRVSALVRLRGRDVDRDACTVLVGDKGRGGEGAELAAVPVTPEVMALLPRPAHPDHFVFPKRGPGRGGSEADPTAHVARGSVLRCVRRAVKAIGVQDPERLDVHGLRRSFCTSADRAKVSADVGRRVTGHRTRAMWDHYQAEAVGDDLHDVVRRVRDRRWPGAVPPAVPPDETRPESERPPGQPGAVQELVVGLEPTASSLRTRVPPCSTATSGGAQREAQAQTTSDDAPRGDRLHGRRDFVHRLTGWTAEDPAAMRRLLQDEEVRTWLLRAIDDFGVGQSDGDAAEVARG